MAAYINRTISLMAGDGPNIRGPSAGLKSNELRSLARENSSPLQIFVNAKKKINDIFGEIEDYVRDTVAYMHALQHEKSVILVEGEAVQVEAYIAKVKGIRDVLKRDHMKVAFFGRTSNGKSTVINAMLREKILPSGIGHTTNCFLQVEGSDTGESYLMTEDSEEKQNVATVTQLAHALCKEKLDESRKVRIFWPKDKCLLLRDDVVFVDSPGIDVSENLDEWIDRHCLDADVFVLVCNAESTLMLTEKNFFHKVSTRLSKPNIFVLNNRWDASANEPEYMDEVRAQHQERTVDFLVKELKVCTLKEANERIFFVSAKEVLQLRLQEQKGQPGLPGGCEGFQVRYFEFQDFERKFEECISKSAVKTKFDQHSQRGKNIAGDIRVLMDGIFERAQRQRTDKLAALKEVHDRLISTEQQMTMVTQEMKEKIHHMVEDVEQRVSKALSEEIRRLGVLVDEFDTPFHSEPLVLNLYKTQLHKHIEQGLGSNLRARLSTALTMNIQASQQEMTDRMSSLLPIDTKQASLSNVLPRREPFQILYRLNCDNLCADFREDLEFRFSWGLTSIIARFGGKRSQNMSIRNLAERIPRDLMTPTSEMSEVTFPSVRPDDWNFMSRVAVATISSQGTMGGLLVAGFMLKTVGWRVILLTGALYGSLYLYERLTFTTKARERMFKGQYVAHATEKLRLIVDLTSANCSHQVQQELSTTFARLCMVVDDAMKDMNTDVKVLDKEVRSLEEAANSAKVLRNRANFVTNKLDLFEESFLRIFH